MPFGIHLRNLNCFCWFLEKNTFICQAASRHTTACATQPISTSPADSTQDFLGLKLVLTSQLMDTTNIPGALSILPKILLVPWFNKTLLENVMSEKNIDVHKLSFTRYSWNHSFKWCGEEMAGVWRPEVSFQP